MYHLTRYVIVLSKSIITILVRKGELPHASPTLKDLISDS